MVMWAGGTEEDRRTERSKIVVRWIVVAVALAAVTYMRRTGTVTTPWGVIVALTSAVAALNVGFAAALRCGAPPWLRYVTTGSDLALISILVAYSGGSASPFYYVYFVVLVSNAVRYGRAMAIFVALGFNVAYVAVLVVHPAADLTAEGRRSWRSGALPSTRDIWRPASSARPASCRRMRKPSSRCARGSPRARAEPGAADAATAPALEDGGVGTPGRRGPGRGPGPGDLERRPARCCSSCIPSWCSACWRSWRWRSCGP